MAKNLVDSKRERELAAREEPKKTVFDFNYDDLCGKDAYVNPQLFRKMSPDEFTLDYYNRTGLNEVLVFDCPPSALGMKMVDDKFGVRDVERLVGGNKVITVVAVASQNSVDMSLKEFVDYYCAPNDGTTRELFNVLSLEFSNSALAELVQSPSLVRQIDWASSWPDERKTRSILFDKNRVFNVLNYYPRVENYCLMSKSQCYTDFHIDFHGSSVWYHVKKGKKIFWIVEPTEQNLKMYEEYLKNPDSSAFFGDLVETCARVEVNPGNTLILPSGWIHAVFTPVDSLVFGGNFLHSRQAMMQLSVLQGEKRMRINKKYRYPFSEETVFFHLAKIVKAVTGRAYIRPMSKNRQMEYMEYVGELFEQKQMNQIVPIKADYEDGGRAWKLIWEESSEYLESRKKLAKWDELEKENKGEEMKDGDNEEKREERSGSRSILNPKKELKDDERDESGMEDEKEQKKKSKEEVEEKPILGGHDDLFVDDFTFYHPISCNLDAGTGTKAMLTLPLSRNEPAMRVDEDALRKEMHPLEVPELEGLIAQILKRSRVDLPWGLTRPNSLLAVFCQLLRRRRGMARDEGIVLPPSILPDKEGQQKKRKWEKKKDKDEGEGEDWTPDEPMKKKGRKSGGQDERGKMEMVTRSMARTEKEASGPNRENIKRKSENKKNTVTK